MPPPGGTIINNVGAVGPYTTDNGPVGQENGPPAQIIVSEVPVDDNAGTINITGNQSQVWTDFRIRSRYETDKHRYMAGITSPGPIGTTGPLTIVGGAAPTPTVAFFQLAAPTKLWIVEWTACRYNVEPDVPDPNITTSPGTQNPWILLDVILEPGMVVIARDGESPMYRISGTYVYGNQTPNAKSILDVNFTRPPWLNDIFQRKIPITVLQQNLITAGF